MANIDEQELFRIMEGKTDVIDFSVVGHRTDFIIAHKEEIIEVMEYLVRKLKAGKYPFSA